MIKPRPSQETVDEHRARVEETYRKLQRQVTDYARDCIAGFVTDIWYEWGAIVGTNDYKVLGPEFSLIDDPAATVRVVNFNGEIIIAPRLGLHLRDGGMCFGETRRVYLKEDGTAETWLLADESQQALRKRVNRYITRDGWERSLRDSLL